MNNADLVKRVAINYDDFGCFIAAFELMVNSSEYKGNKKVAFEELDYMKFMNRNGCKTYDYFIYSMN